jgi:hypothetical protein
MSQHYYSANAFDTFLSAALTAGQSTLTVPENGADNGWPSTFPYYLQVDSGSSEEIVEVTSKGALAGAVRTWNVNRAIGTPGVVHSSGMLVRHVWTAGDAQDASDHVNSDGTSLAIHPALPRGSLVHVNTWAARATPTNGAETVMGSAAAVTIVTGRLYLMRLRGIISRSDQAADLARIRFRLGTTVAGTAIMDEYAVLNASAVGDFFYFEMQFSGAATTVVQSNTAGSTNVLTTIAAGVTGICYSVEKNSGSGNAATMNLSRAQMLFEDKGLV